MAGLPFTRKIVEDWGGAQAFQQGMSIFERGAVQKVELNGAVISGEILKNPRPIKSSLRLTKDGHMENLCPCTDNRVHGLVCAHAIALCLDLLKIYSDPARKEKLEAEQRRAKRLEGIGEQEYIQRADFHHGNSIKAEISLALPPNWKQQLLDENTLPVSGTIAYGDILEMLDEAPRDIPFELSEKHENLLFVLEDISEGPAQGTIDVRPVDFINLLELLIGDHILDQGSGESYPVNAAQMTSHLLLDLDRENGELILMVETPIPFTKATDFPTYVISKTKGWAFGGRNFWPLENLLPEPLHGIYREPVVVPREGVPLFLENEFVMLQKFIEVQTDIMPELFERRPARPQYRLVVKGSPASLSATLQADYGNGVDLIAGKFSPEGQFAIPDKQDLMLYDVRNLEHEKKACERLSDFGVGGPLGDDLNSVIGTRPVLNFLASSVPAIRRMGWKVDLQGSVSNHFDELDYATPVVSVEEGGGGPSASSGANWFEIGFEFDAGEGESLSSAEIHRAIRNGDSFVESKGKTYLFDRDAVESMTNVFQDCASGAAGTPGHFRMDGIFSAYVQSSLNALDGVDVEAPSTWQQSAGIQNRTSTIENVPLDEPLNGILRDYQKEGVNWLRFNEQNGYAGILADEMGLGKTLQTLTWLSLERCHEMARDKNCLIVCPTSLVENWIDEAEKFTPHLKFCNLTGSDRHERWDEIETADVVVTSYALVRRDIEKYQAHQFAIAVLDEAQHIKNRSTQNAIAAKSLNSIHRVVLTGTPVENSVNDLWSIMDFLMPNYLGPHEQFKFNYEQPISNGGAPAEQAQKKLRRKLHPFLLRRLKKDVAKDLPPKIEKVAYCHMTKDQRLVYRELVQSAQEKLSDLVAKQGYAKSKMEVFKTLLRLRQASCHLDLLKMKGLKSKNPSGKMELFFELMEEAIDGGHRVLVFSQFTTMLAIIREEFERRNYRYCYLDGSTKHRMREVKLFNGDPGIPAFLISLKAGGTGLNLTGADMVVHFDPWWNPAVEAQATDRAYRIGQKRTVLAQKLITRGTVEEKVLEMQRRKQAVIDATLEQDDQVMEKMSWEDVQDLLAL